MKQVHKAVLAMLGPAAVCCFSLHAQTRATAQRRLDLSAFALFSGTYTGLGSSPYANAFGVGGPTGRNLTFSAGVDLGVYSYRSFDLGVEVRGAYPMDKGQVDGQKSILAGVRVTREPGGAGALGRVRPYVDFLAGRGQINFQNGGYLLPGVLYFSNNSAVYDGGGGLEFYVTRQFSVKVDAQYQHWNTPVTASGSIHAAQGGIGLVYRYGAGGSPR